MRIKNSLLLLSLATVVAANVDVHAWTWGKCGSTYAKWTSSSVTMRASSVGFPVGPWRDALDETRTSWNDQPSNFYYGISWNEPGVALHNGESEIWWDNNFGYVAATWTWVNGSCRYTEADIKFDNTVAYHYTHTQSSLSPYGGTYRPFQTTMMHELGHAQGLGHTNNTYAVMGVDYTHIHANCGSANAYPGADAVNGSKFVYGLWAGSKEEWSVAHWRYTGFSGEYSTHGRTRVLSTANAELPKITVGGEPVYKVNKGQQVKFEMTYENWGKSSPSTVQLKFYVSSNNCITSADTYLGPGSFTLYTGTYTSAEAYLTIPSNLVSGQTYYLGVIADSNNALTEFREWNNATYTAIKIN